MKEKEKIYLNGIPVYRREDDDQIEYTLYEDDYNSSVLWLSKQETRVEEYTIVLKGIVNLIGINNSFKHGINARPGNWK